MIRVTGDRVLVALPPKVHVQEETTGYTYQEGHTTGTGIVLAKPADVYNVELATRGIVVAVGEKPDLIDRRTVLSLIADGVGEVDGQTLLERVGALAPAPFDVAIGDCVIFAASAGDQIDLNGVSLIILHESEIIGVVDPIEAP